MTGRSLLRLFLGLALGVLIASAWSTQSQAHAGHAKAAPTAASQVEPASIETAVNEDAAECGARAGGAPAGSAGSACCGEACHAVMAAETQGLQTASVIAASGPDRPDATALSGPAIHIKRPPRPSAALVG